MKKICLFILALLAITPKTFSQKNNKDLFPDGTKIPDWFLDATKINPADLGKFYSVTDYGAKNDSTIIQTAAIQNTIDEAYKNGGGVVVIPKGTFMSGALFFKPNTHLHVSEGAVLKGSDNINDYPKMPSRIEGQSIEYFTALVNAYGINGFTITGKGTIDGNGLKFWEAFWQRRKENPQCTNLEVSRPRLVFIWKCDNVQVQDVKLHNSGFWTSHYYQCNNVKILDLHIFSPHEPVKAPSTDAIDIDVCTNMLIKGCYMAVNDDAIALKGGKGPWADKDFSNGGNQNIIIEDCEFGFCHAALTSGSEAIHNKNILMRNCKVNDAKRLLWLKMRPDTPQNYEYITVENITGYAYSLIYVKPWTQFFDLKGRKEAPLSYSDHITLRNIDLKCDVFYDMKVTEYDKLTNFTFENLKVEAKNDAIDKSIIKGLTLKNVIVNNKVIK
ncbi:Glycosyl hydrolases family 28 [Flavobacterium flevense]|uniref:Exopolygalacturonase n=1 Tax=Flavobacterium flevense TaxID=983 RepID=A0A4Y4AYR6_9FLAO|nr:glycosyl hydrolase family 28 protein [Flavobacterium flevense]GEC72292.1 exopolygalacturonase [Flavobacterium flevense]SHL66085.1 Glycosyl hydrolases family 28 [Flavobacterium flevense]